MEVYRGTEGYISLFTSMSVTMFLGPRSLTDMGEETDRYMAVFSCLDGFVNIFSTSVKWVREVPIGRWWDVDVKIGVIAGM